MPHDTNMGVGVVRTGGEIVTFVVVIALVTARAVVVTLVADLGAVVVIDVDVSPCVVGDGVEVDDRVVDKDVV